uniref:Uncharacterized protein n=1 Tax=Grammatophora oceanica TaxID=210454 RepID=A0A7S1UQC5_9STRA|mmetsp:Transcript_14575/g.21469  ORF Transcript_14575/g.21469 Transcript_14575/m.21469 type:complete len:106 (+) Transcript_14575:66-383(+)
MLRSTVARRGRQMALTTQRRGYPANMKAQPNKWVDEWNGLKEITEYTFEVTQGNVGHLLLWAVAFPVWTYWYTRDEFCRYGDRRFKELYNGEHELDVVASPSEEE